MKTKIIRTSSEHAGLVNHFKLSNTSEPNNEDIIKEIHVK